MLPRTLVALFVGMSAIASAFPVATEGKIEDLQANLNTMDGLRANLKNMAHTDELVKQTPPTTVGKSSKVSTQALQWTPEMIMKLYEGINSLWYNVFNKELELVQKLR